MKIKHLKGKKVIELSSSEFDDLVQKTNEINNMVSTMLEAQDIWLSDVGKIDSLKYRLVEFLGLRWDSDTYRYSPEVGLQ